MFLKNSRGVDRVVGPGFDPTALWGNLRGPGGGGNSDKKKTERYSIQLSFPVKRHTNKKPRRKKTTTKNICQKYVRTESFGRSLWRVSGW